MSVVGFLAARLGDFCLEVVFVEDFAPLLVVTRAYAFCPAAPLGGFFARMCCVSHLLCFCPAAPLGDFCSDVLCLTLIVLLSGCTLRQLLLGRVVSRTYCASVRLHP